MDHGKDTCPSPPSRGYATVTWRWRLFWASVLVGALFMAGAVWVTPGLATCPGCAVLSHPAKGCTEHVTEGWICP